MRICNKCNDDFKIWKYNERTGMSCKCISVEFKGDEE